jgi:hypothetical protein
MAVVKAYGKLTNSCMFCGQSLTDDRSISTGCGERCAEHHGLLEQWKTALKNTPTEHRE